MEYNLQILNFYSSANMYSFHTIKLPKSGGYLMSIRSNKKNLVDLIIIISCTALKYTGISGLMSKETLSGEEPEPETGV